MTIGRIDPFILHKEHPSVGGPGGIHRIILMDNVLSRITVSENISDWRRKFNLAENDQNKRHLSSSCHQPASFLAWYSRIFCSIQLLIPFIFLWLKMVIELQRGYFFDNSESPVQIPDLGCLSGAHFLNSADLFPCEINLAVSCWFMIAELQLSDSCSNYLPTLSCHHLSVLQRLEKAVDWCLALLNKPSLKQVAK